MRTTHWQSEFWAERKRSNWGETGTQQGSRIRQTSWMEDTRRGETRVRGEEAGASEISRNVEVIGGKRRIPHQWMKMGRSDISQPWVEPSITLVTYGNYGNNALSRPRMHRRHCVSIFAILQRARGIITSRWQ
ncbi:uncharacterized protein CIMG_13065 [Coccidioides immitis RS]|uniref:Uncharacterized protein n=1 Tax=Coccidioides immitis (strain RS) TaxID=246410 RepID=A0A0D8JTX8_COCIM|nr:uncharacterized protein CIMG_13065 [Coccidioides immitis RS]KJF60594.1 hypothetical protein CIMG_13065 [Coccidioides immitis RS]